MGGLLQQSELTDHRAQTGLFTHRSFVPFPAADYNRAGIRTGPDPSGRITEQCE